MADNRKNEIDETPLVELEIPPEDVLAEATKLFPNELTDWAVAGGGHSVDEKAHTMAWAHKKGRGSFPCVAADGSIHRVTNSDNMALRPAFPITPEIRKWLCPPSSGKIFGYGACLQTVDTSINIETLNSYAPWSKTGRHYTTLIEQSSFSWTDTQFAQINEHHINGKDVACFTARVAQENARFPSNNQIVHNGQAYAFCRAPMEWVVVKSKEQETAWAVGRKCYFSTAYTAAAKYLERASHEIAPRLGEPGYGYPIEIQLLKKTEDLKPLAKAYADYYKNDSGLNEKGWTLSNTIETFLWYYDHFPRCFLVAYDGDKPVGCTMGAIQRYQGKTQLTKPEVFVKEEYRNRSVYRRLLLQQAKNAKEIYGADMIDAISYTRDDGKKSPIETYKKIDSFEIYNPKLVPCGFSDINAVIKQLTDELNGTRKRPNRSSTQSPLIVPDISATH